MCSSCLITTLPAARHCCGWLFLRVLELVGFMVSEPRH